MPIGLLPRFWKYVTWKISFDLVEGELPSNEEKTCTPMRCFFVAIIVSESEKSSQKAANHSIAELIQAPGFKFI